MHSHVVLHVAAPLPRPCSKPAPLWAAMISAQREHQGCIFERNSKRRKYRHYNRGNSTCGGCDIVLDRSQQAGGVSIGILYSLLTYRSTIFCVILSVIHRPQADAES